MGEYPHHASLLLWLSMTDTGVRNFLPISSRLRGITLELTHTSSWRNQASMCTPTGQAPAVTCQPPPTRHNPSSQPPPSAFYTQTCDQYRVNSISYFINKVHSISNYVLLSVQSIS